MHSKLPSRIEERLRLKNKGGFTSGADAWQLMKGIEQNEGGRNEGKS